MAWASKRVCPHIAKLKHMNEEKMTKPEMKMLWGHCCVIHKKYPKFQTAR